MDRDQWVREASEAAILTERQAEALYRRQSGESRQEAADAMDCSPSNIDNLESDARSKIIYANNLLALADVIGADPKGDAHIGTCAECDKPSSALTPHPHDDGPLEDRRMVCEECGEKLQS